MGRVSRVPRRQSSPRLAALLAILVCAGSIALVGCGAPSDKQAATNSAPVKGGTLKLVGQPVTLDPATCGDVDSAMVDHCLYETLYGYAAGPLGKGTKLEPGLAAEMPSVSADGKVYRITLRTNSRFAPPVDRPVTATDVRYSFERMLHEPLAVYTFFYASILGADEYMSGEADHVEGFRVVDERTIELRLKEPDPTLVHAFALAPTGVVPREWVEKWGRKFGQHPLGSGPFMLEKWSQSSKATLKRNPKYWKAEEVWLDGVEFLPYSSSMTDMMKLQRGQLDLCWASQADYVKLRSDPKWWQYYEEELQVSQNYLVINTQMEPFDDVRVRQALNWAIDRDRNAKMHGCPPSYQILPKGMPGYIDGAKYYGYDPGQAKLLLAAAGYPEGFKTTLSVSAESDSANQVAQAVQDDLRQVGVDAAIERRPGMSYFTELATPKTIALGVSGWWMDFPDPYDWVKPLFSKSAAVENGTNYSFWWDAQVEEMLDDAQATLDEEERIAKFSDIQEVISDNAPIVPLYQLLAGALRSPAVGGFYIHPLYGFDPEHYWSQESRD